MHQKWLKRAELRMAMDTQVVALGTGRAAEPEEGQVWGCGGRGWAVSVEQGRGRCCPAWEHLTLEPRERATEIGMGDISAWMITNPTGA